MSLLATGSQGTQDEEQSPTGDRRLSLANVSQRLSNWGRRTSATSRATIHTNHSYNSNHVSPSSPDVVSPTLSPIPQSPRPDLPSRPSQSVIITLPPARNQGGEESDSAASTGEFPDVSSFSGPPPTSKTGTPKRGSIPGMEEHVQLAAYQNGAVTAAPVSTVKRLSPRQVNKRLSLLMMLCEGCSSPRRRGTELTRPSTQTPSRTCYFSVYQSDVSLLPSSPLHQLIQH